MSRDMESSLILVDMGCPSPARRSHGEPETGANAGRLTKTDRDAFRALLQVRGSPANSVRPVQTGHS